MIQQSDTVAGAYLASTGGTMLTLQALTGFGSFLLIVVNLMLALGGLFLMWPRIVKRWREIRNPE